MKLALSNLAWELEHDAAVLDIMVDHGVRGVELAPTKVFADPLAASAQELQDYRASWLDRGIQIVALQALLFGKPELTLFDGEAARASLLDHLAGMARVGGTLGVETLVFGSPRNRLVGNLPREDAMAIAVPFFRRAGALAAEHDVALCIEPNPERYGCDFVRTSTEGAELVNAVDHPGFGLHLDAAGLSLGGEDVDRAIRECAGAIRHFHASEPDLGALGEGSVDHARAAAALRGTGYDRWVSVEMRHDPSRDTVREIERVAALVAGVYGSLGV
jgi:sugar phosphate isomerase/epimerase